MRSIAALSRAKHLNYVSVAVFRGFCCFYSPGALALTGLINTVGRISASAIRLYLFMHCVAATLT
jgi:hypothetical protein